VGQAIKNDLPRLARVEHVVLLAAHLRLRLANKPRQCFLMLA
jgi:hypothetical protein